MKNYVKIILLILVIFPLSLSATSNLADKLAGRILLQVEKKGEAWYINPINKNRYFLGHPSDAFQVMRKLGLGISEKNYHFFNGIAPKNLSGRILLRVEANGEAYYVNPLDLKMHYLGRPQDAFNVMRNLGLGITNNDLLTINIDSDSLGENNNSGEVASNHDSNKVTTDEISYFIDDMDLIIKRNKVTEKALVEMIFKIKAEDEYKHDDLSGQIMTGIPALFNMTCTTLPLLVSVPWRVESLIKNNEFKRNDSKDEEMPDYLDGYTIEKVLIKFVQIEDRENIAYCESDMTGDENIKVEVFKDYSNVNSLFDTKIGDFSDINAEWRLW